MVSVQAIKTCTSDCAATVTGDLWTGICRYRAPWRKTVLQGYCVPKGWFTLNDTPQTWPDNDMTGKWCYGYFKWACSHSTTKARQQPTNFAVSAAAVWTGGPTQSRRLLFAPCLISVFILFHITNTEQLIGLVSTNPLWSISTKVVTLS
jgi:hypothetical protein